MYIIKTRVQPFLCICILGLTLINGVLAITFTTDVTIDCGDYQMGFTQDTEFNSMTIGSDYVNYSFDGITFYNSTDTWISNITSTQSLIELNGVCSMGNHTTVIGFDVFAPGTLTPSLTGSTAITNGSNTDTISSTPTLIWSNNTHKHYTFTYDPSNTLTAADMGPFDINLTVNMSNNTMYWTGYNISNNLFDVYELTPIGNVVSHYNATLDSVNFTWGSSSENVYYFNESDGIINWNSGGLMNNFADGDTDTFAYAYSQFDDHKFIRNTCDGTGSGNITKVEIRIHGYQTGGMDVDLYPLINGTHTSDYNYVDLPYTSGWSEWIDITSGTYCPSTWNYTYIKNLDLLVDSVGDPGDSLAYGSKVEIRVSTSDTAASGDDVDSYVVVRSNTSQPLCPDDGYEVQNSTSGVYNTARDFTTAYFTIFTYNSTTNSYSTGYNMTWGGLNITVFKETNATIPITNYSVLITNDAGTETYYTPQQNNPFTLSLEDIPNGEDTAIKVDKAGYYHRVKYMDLLNNTYYPLVFYLPPSSSGGGTPGSGDYIPPTDPDDPDYDYNATQNESYAQQYLLQVQDEIGNPVKNAKVNVKRYINTTDNFESIILAYTDGNGEMNCYLVPGSLLKVDVSHSSGDYINATNEPFVPSENNLIKTFTLEFTEDDTQPPENPAEHLTFNGYITGTTLQVNYTDATDLTINSQIYVYEINQTTGNTTLLTSWSNTGDSDYTRSVTVNTSNSYNVILHMNHTHWGHQKQSFLISTGKTTPTTQTETESIFTNVFGSNIFGWSNFIMWLFVIAGFYYADQKDRGFVMIFMGGILLFINYFIGFNTILSVIAGGALPVLLIVVGIIVVYQRAGGVAS